MRSILWVSAWLALGGCEDLGIPGLGDEEEPVNLADASLPAPSPVFVASPDCPMDAPVETAAAAEAALRAVAACHGVEAV